MAMIGRALANLLLLLVVAVCGCGWQQYESRMQASASYYEYLGRVNTSLSGHVEEGVSEFGITFRVPARFRWIEAGQRSRRHPFGRRELPGLLGSWNSVVVNKETGKEAAGRSRMYLFGNYTQFQQRNEGTSNVNPMEFHEDLVSQLVGALGMDSPAEAEWKYEQIPKRGGYVEPKDYTLVELSRGNTEFRLYLYPARATANTEDNDAPADSEHLQFAFLFEIPANTTSPVKLDTGITHCLEWIQITGAVPQPLAPGEESGGGGEAGF